ncbi:hypothetical protein BDA99DRAFT_556395 [Phascolomyces articulosus]|uniref:Uncharacterized protein n=1 Tax=Phascolomyces articulosus TaxID=60185 RepID=A0AAD5KP71_9FUNG|nr:hypothetical protein BDA99DRAFT_556395 [Phascolomyces articulosus]
MPETDQQYLPFEFFSTIFLGSDTKTRGTEISSEANANAINASRIFKYESQELGCYMLLPATYDSSLLHSTHIIGYSITDGCASLLDVNIPAGFITRVRKTNSLNFPHTEPNLVSRLLPLMTLAYHGKRIIDETVDC